MEYLLYSEYGQEVAQSKWETPPRVVENRKAKILWDILIHTDTQVKSNQQDIVVINKQKKKTVVIDVANPSHVNPFYCLGEVTTFVEAQRQRVGKGVGVQSSGRRR